MEHHRILRLEANNIKNLRAVTITPNGKPVVITGKNGAGKSAIFDSILLAMTNAGLADPIRHGANKASVRLDIGEIEIERTFTRKGSYVTVKLNGEIQKSPQSLLDSLFGDLTFDPLGFSKMKPADQRAIMMRAARLDFSALDKQRQAAYEDRTMANRELKKLEGYLASLAQPEANTPDQPERIQERMAALNELRRQQKAGFDARMAKNAIEKTLDSKHADIKRTESEIDRLLREVERLKAVKAQQDAEILDLIDRVKSYPIPESPNEEAIKAAEAAVENVERVNERVRRKQSYANAKRDVEKAKQNAESLTQKIDGLDDTKRRQIESAAFPVIGLSIDDNQVLYSGIPLQQLSTAEQIKVSTAVAMTQNPKLRVILIREGSLLDDTSFEAVCELAREQDYQVWLEKVSSEGDPASIHIEDGSIVSVNGEAIDSDQVVEQESATS